MRAFISKEVLASQAERSSIRYKQVEYMQQYVGYGSKERFQDLQSGVFM